MQGALRTWLSEMTPSSISSRKCLVCVRVCVRVCVCVFARACVCNAPGFHVAGCWCSQYATHDQLTSGCRTHWHAPRARSTRPPQAALTPAATAQPTADRGRGRGPCPCRTTMQARLQWLGPAQCSDASGCDDVSRGTRRSCK
jgi:hypothetical protein